MLPWKREQEGGILPKRFYISFLARSQGWPAAQDPHSNLGILVRSGGGRLNRSAGPYSLASSYVRMLSKVSSYNQLRAEREDLKPATRILSRFPERDIQVVSLGSLASEVSSLYGLKADPMLIKASAADQVEESAAQFVARPALQPEKDAALSGANDRWPFLGLTRNVTTADWDAGEFAPNLYSQLKAR
jgi:hypothetical protein